MFHSNSGEVIDFILILNMVIEVHTTSRKLCMHRVLRTACRFLLDTEQPGLVIHDT